MSTVGFHWLTSMEEHRGRGGEQSAIEQPIEEIAHRVLRSRRRQRRASAQLRYVTVILIAVDLPSSDADGQAICAAG